MLDILSSEPAMYGVVLAALLVNMILVLYRAFHGPTVFDSILAASSLGSKTVLLIAVLSFLMGRPDLIDLALVYSLMNFISTIAVMRFSTIEDEPDDHHVDDDQARQRAQWT